MVDEGLESVVDDLGIPCLVVGLEEEVEGNVAIIVVVGLNVLFIDDVECAVVPTAFIE